MKNFLRELDQYMTQVFSSVIKWLVYICFAIFLFMVIGGSFSNAVGNGIVEWLGASLDKTILHGCVWQLVTYMFVHGGATHLLFNLLALYLFGQRLEYRWGSKEFLRFCLIVGVGSVFTHLAVSAIARYGFGYGLNPVIIGISGLVYGIMMVCALYYPDDIVYLQFIMPIKMKYLVIIMGILTFVGATQSGTGIAHLTHLGGLVFGYLYVKQPWLFDWIPTLRVPFRRRKPEFVDPRERWRTRK